MQGRLPLSGTGTLYECANPECFCCGTLQDMHEVVWKDFWNSSLEILDIRATCPSCTDPMMIWDIEGEPKDAKTQTFV